MNTRQERELLSRAQRYRSLHAAEQHFAGLKSYEALVLMAEYRRRGVRTSRLEARVAELEAQVEILSGLGRVAS
jgi:uncharacterized protein YceH (UPF0502 family)